MYSKKIVKALPQRINVTDSPSFSSLSLTGQATVHDDLSAGGNVYGANLLINNWNSVYSNVNGLSGNWSSVYSNVNGLSGNWSSVYSNVNGLSGNWNNAYTWVTSNSAEAKFASMSASNISAANVNVTGTLTSNILKLTQASEKFSVYSASINNQVVNLDCANGNIFYITSNVNQNWTVNFLNLTLDPLYATNITLVLVQDAAPFIPTTFQINGSTKPINWQAGYAPGGNPGKKDVIAFSILNNNGTYIVFGQLVTFG